jgi:ribokinase
MRRPRVPSRPAFLILLDILIVNAIEAEMLGAGAVSSLETAAGAAQSLAASFKSVVVTAGGDGVASFERCRHALKLPGIEVAVASTHGAGDAFVGTLAARIAVRDPFEIALSTANQEAAKLVATPEGERGL